MKDNGIENTVANLVSLPAEHDVLIHHHLVLRPEGEMAVRHLEYEDTQCPPGDG